MNALFKKRTNLKSQFITFVHNTKMIISVTVNSESIANACDSYKKNNGRSIIYNGLDSVETPAYNCWNLSHLQEICNFICENYSQCSQRESSGSYGLKHEIEESMFSYIANGELILCAELLNIEQHIQSYEKDPNTDICMIKNSFDLLGKGPTYTFARRGDFGSY